MRSGATRPGRITNVRWSADVEGKPVVVDALAAELAYAGIPGEMDHDQRADFTTSRLNAAPRTAVRAGHTRDLDDALRPDHDVLQIELHVRECAQERHIEIAGAGMALPALAGRHDLIGAVVGERVDQALEVATILSARVLDPQSPNRLVLLGAGLPVQTFADRCERHRAGHCSPLVSTPTRCRRHLAPRAPKA